MLRTFVANENADRRRGGVSALTAVYVLDAADPHTAEPQAAGKGDRLPIPMSAQTKILSALTDLPAVRFVATRNDVIESSDPHGQRVRGGDVLTTLGTVPRQGDRVAVGINGWTTSLNGQWSTYVLERRDAVWAVAGDTGSHVIA